METCGTISNTMSTYTHLYILSGPILAGYSGYGIQRLWDPDKFPGSSPPRMIFFIAIYTLMSVMFQDIAVFDEWSRILPNTVDYV